MAREKRRAGADGGKARIIVVDDHPIVRQGLSDFIGREQDLEVCGQAEDAPAAMKEIKALSPDVVIVDISLKTTDGLELIKDIVAHYPTLPILVLSMYDESLYAERALHAGAKGYVMKEAVSKKIVMAIRKVLAGKVYLSDKMTEKLMSRVAQGQPELNASPVNCLSNRELEVFTLLGRGFGTRQISEQLHLSVKTIETYRLRIREKLNVSDATELHQHAFQWVNSQGKQ